MKMRYIICFFSFLIVFLFSYTISYRLLERRMTPQILPGEGEIQYGGKEDGSQGIQGRLAHDNDLGLQAVEESLIQDETAAQEAEMDQGKVVAEYAYFITAEDGFITVYQEDSHTVYLHTSIEIKGMKDEEQERLLKGFFVESEQELFDYLENHTS